MNFCTQLTADLVLALASCSSLYSYMQKALFSIIRLIVCFNLHVVAVISAYHSL